MLNHNVQVAWQRINTFRATELTIAVESLVVHKVHWTRPRTRRPTRLDKHIDLSLIHNFREPRQSPSITRRPTHILQFEHYSEHFSNGLFGILGTSSVMESGTVEIVCRLWAMRVDGGRVGEFFGVEVSILEAGPDTVASLYFEWWEAISLRD